MKIKTAELKDTAIDWAVTYALYGEAAHYIFEQCRRRNCHSTDWAQGGPIIERECITVAIGDWDVDQTPIVQTWSARSLVCEIHAATNDGWLCGPTPLIAAMRCFVASKLGDEVEVPDELS